MSGTRAAVIAGVALGIAAGPAAAQATREPQERQVPREVVRQRNQARTQFELRYQIGTMERVLENAVEHGASLWRDRLQALAPVQALLLDNARVRGVRLDGYGVLFYVDVPSLETTLFSAFRTLDQNGLGLQDAMNRVKDYIHAQAAGDDTLQQAVKRLELQVVPPAAVAATTADVSAARPVSGASTVPDSAPAVDVNDPILASPEEVYRAEVMSAIVDALLDHSAALGIGLDEWLTVAVRRNEVRPRIGLETNAQTVVARVRGGDLSAFRGGQLSREDAIKRVEVRVF